VSITSLNNVIIENNINSDLRSPIVTSKNNEKNTNFNGNDYSRINSNIINVNRDLCPTNDVNNMDSFNSKMNLEKRKNNYVNNSKNHLISNNKNSNNNCLSNNSNKKINNKNTVNTNNNSLGSIISLTDSNQSLNLGLNENSYNNSGNHIYKSRSKTNIISNNFINTEINSNNSFYNRMDGLIDKLKTNANPDTLIKEKQILSLPDLDKKISLLSSNSDINKNTKSNSNRLDLLNCLKQKEIEILKAQKITDIRKEDQLLCKS